jgi:hypothetical protein
VREAIQSLAQPHPAERIFMLFQHILALELSKQCHLQFSRDENKLCKPERFSQCFFMHIKEEGLKRSLHLTSYILKDYEFQQAETLVELHSFTFITIYLYSF